MSFSCCVDRIFARISCPEFNRESSPFFALKKNRIVPLNEAVKLRSRGDYSFLPDLFLAASSNRRQKLINVQNSIAVSLCLLFWVSEPQNLSFFLHF